MNMNWPNLRRGRMRLRGSAGKFECSRIICAECHFAFAKIFPFEFKFRRERGKGSNDPRGRTGQGTWPNLGQGARLLGVSFSARRNCPWVCPRGHPSFKTSRLILHKDCALLSTWAPNWVNEVGPRGNESWP